MNTKDTPKNKPQPANNAPNKQWKSLAQSSQRQSPAGAMALVDALEPAIIGMHALASALDLPAPVVYIHGRVNNLRPELAPKLHALFEHLFADAVFHGIDSEEARTARGVPGRGLITVFARTLACGAVSVWVGDDGMPIEFVFKHARDTDQGVELDPQRASAVQAANAVASEFGGYVEVRVLDEYHPAPEPTQRRFGFAVHIPREQLLDSADAALASR